MPGRAELGPILQHEPADRRPINPPDHNKHGHSLQASKEQHEFLEILPASIHRGLYDASLGSDPRPRRADLLAEPGARGLLHDILFHVHCDLHCTEPTSEIPDQKPKTFAQNNLDHSDCQFMFLHWFCRLQSDRGKVRLDTTNRVLRQHRLLHQ